MRHALGRLTRDVASGRNNPYGSENVSAVSTLCVDVEPLALDRAGFIVGQEVVVISAADFARLGTLEAVSWSDKFAARSEPELSDAIVGDGSGTAFPPLDENHPDRPRDGEAVTS